MGHSIPAREYSPLTLAFLGDSVYELLVRNYLVSQGNCPVRSLNGRKVKLVCARAQARALEKLLPYLAGDEMEIVLRGRNAHVHAPRNADIADYHAATALEALFGYLFLEDRGPRMGLLFAAAMQEAEEQEGL